MKFLSSSKRRVAIAAALLFCVPVVSIAQDFPNKPISIIVPFGPGSGTDGIARLMAVGLTKKLGAAVSVENKAGAGGIIGTSAAARSSGDGYTLLLATSGPLAANVSLYNSLPYNPLEDFEPVVLIGRQPMIVIGSKEARAQTFGEIVDEAKANPGKINFGASSTTARVLTELLKKNSGVQVETVLYKDVGSLMTDLINNRIQYAFENPGASMALITADKVSFIAVASEKRAPFAAGVPATGEYGFRDYGLITWYGLFAPKGTPEPVLAKLRGAANEVLKGPEMSALARRVGIDIAEDQPATIRRFHAGEVTNWKSLLDLTGVKLN